MRPDSLKFPAFIGQHCTAKRRMTQSLRHYLGSQEASAMGRLSDDELEMVSKSGMKPSDYLAYK
jgi:hypothetical protein